MKIAALLLSVACALGGCATRPFAAFEDPRPEGRLSVSERSQCEVPAASSEQANWCELPHEVRRFVEERDGCDHFRGEPWPEGDSTAERERRQELKTAMKAACTGTDAQLRALRAKYPGDAMVVAALAAYENDIER